MSRVDAVFQEFQNRQDGLIKALNENLDTLIDEAKKIGNETPYLERKCLWGLEDKGWELRHAAYRKFKAPPQPQPLPPFEGMSPSEWTDLVASYSYGWLIAYLGYLSSSFSLEERKEILEKIGALPSMGDVIVLEEKYASYPDVDSVVVTDRKSTVQQVDGKSV